MPFCYFWNEEKLIAQYIGNVYLHPNYYLTLFYSEPVSTRDSSSITWELIRNVDLETLTYRDIIYIAIKSQGTEQEAQ